METLLRISFLLLLFSSTSAHRRHILDSSLQSSYYQGLCNGSDAERIIRVVVEASVAADKTLAPALLRMHFHDAFVRGAEGSVLLKSSNNDAERDGIPNLTLRGFEVIDAAKQAVEAACPGVVSCADILSLSARDAVYAIGGPWWPVPTGRRDGLESHASETIDLPPPFANFSVLQTMFAKKGMDIVDLVALSGAHTIGRSHCPAFASRIYDASGNPTVDNTLDQDYASTLRRMCPSGNGIATVEMDPQSSLSFDPDYYKAVLNQKGLFTSDAALLTNRASLSLVKIAAAAPQLFAQRFRVSMVKLGGIGVLTGQPGEPASEIRANCAFVN